MTERAGQGCGEGGGRGGEQGAPREGKARKEKARDLEAGIALLWDERNPPTRGPKPTLTPRRIAEAAVVMADAEGLDAISMNKVAAGFGVSGMALYRYVPGKNELVELMIEAVLAARPDLSGTPPDWRSRLTAWARHCHAVYAAHPWLLAATGMRRRNLGPAELAWLDAALAALEPTNLTAAQRHRVFLLVIGLVRNIAQQTADADSAHEQEWNRLTGELLARNADRFPALTRAVADGVFAPDPEDPLEFGLERILDGVQVLIDLRG
ncbi:TetR/AcrR family transcriptional regulator [Nocardia inohanensis]|uniref:TetR/AcrR family transcriptional regulator n=1 Tax=Nocardia inohanensis TaxID=209246 RepID=UPI000A060BB6|nr:TetR/AcrR family transcriptional regulator [Nocardia inohanensis]